jgi:hypothetical protein
MAIGSQLDLKMVTYSFLIFKKEPSYSEKKFILEEFRDLIGKTIR